MSQDATPPEHDDIDRIQRARLDKLARLEETGVRGYPTKFVRTHLSREIVDGFDALEGQSVTVAGRVGVTRSLGKKLAFLPLSDDAGSIQLFVRPADFDEANKLIWDTLDPGDFLGVTGPVMKTQKGEISVEATQLTFLSKSLRNPPEKWHGLTDVETRYRQRYLDLISNPESREVFMVRGRMIAAIRSYLNERGFIEVETPILQPIAGGGAARPFVTESNSLDSTMFMRIALELYLKRIIVGGIEKVYEIGKNFRNEGASFKHNPEFTMMELYEAYADYNDVMALTEDMIASAAVAVTGGTAVPFGEHTLELKAPWTRMTIRDAIAEFSGVDYEKYPDDGDLMKAAREAGLRPEATWNRGKVLDELLTMFVEPKLIQPTFLTDYPTAFPGSTLAKGKPGDPKHVERFEAFAAGMEIANAFSELNDPRVQRERFEEQVRARALGDDEAQPFDEDFLAALEHGMPPTGGLGVGIDRIAMLLTNSRSIRDVILFPQMRPRD